MRSIRSSFQKWLGAKKVEGTFLILTRASDPLSALQNYKSNISDELIEALLGYSYQLSEAEGIQRGLYWVEVARQASLIGGSANSLADCLQSRANLLLDLYDAEVKARSHDHVEVESILDDALQDALKSLEIFDKSQSPEETRRVLALISMIYRMRGDIPQAFSYRLQSITILTSLANVADALPTSIDALMNLYWHIEEEDLPKAAQMLLDSATTIQKLSAQCPDDKQCGDMFDALRNACSTLDEQDAAFQYGKRAAAYYAVARAQAEEFQIWGVMQQYAAKLGLMERVIEYGKFSIQAAPSDTNPSDLAGRYHLLATAECNMNRLPDAVLSYHHAAGLYDKSEKDSHGAGECLLEAAIIEAGMGMLAEAQADLEQILERSGGIYTFWLAESWLAQVLLQRRGSLGAAIEYANKALRTSVAHHLNFTLRAESYQQSALAYFRAGQFDKVLDRCESLLKILAEKPEEITLKLGPLSEHPISPPSIRGVILLALFAARSAKMAEQVSRYSEMLKALDDAEIAESIPSKVLKDEDADSDDLFNGLEMLERGSELFFVQPQQARSLLENAVPLLIISPAASIMVNRLLGMINLLTGETQAARSYFNRAIDLLAQTPNDFEEAICHFNLGMIDVREERYEDAYKRILTVIKIREAERLSLKDIDQRITFLQKEAETYQGFIFVCLRLGRFAEALETIEKIKSRVLVDMLGQEDKKPIDYSFLNQLQGVRTELEKWMGTHLLQTFTEVDNRFMKQMEEDPENAEHYLEKIIQIDETIKGHQQHAQQTRLFLEFESQNISLSFAEIRALCGAH